ncbi:hypothetical protein ACJ41O_009224 [Fusarium nematophilum]
MPSHNQLGFYMVVLLAILKSVLLILEIGLDVGFTHQWTKLLQSWTQLTESKKLFDKETNQATPRKPVDMAKRLRTSSRSIGLGLQLLMATMPDYRKQWELQYDIEVLSLAYVMKFENQTNRNSEDLSTAWKEAWRDQVLSSKLEECLEDLDNGKSIYSRYEKRRTTLYRRMRSRTDKFTRLCNGALGVFLAAFGGAAFYEMKIRFSADSDPCTDVDADLVGYGVRGGAWAQCGILIFVVLYGSWDFEETAAKEIGAGLLLTHFSLTIALLVPLIRQDLSPTDGILGAMVLDVQNVSLSVQLMVREALAARWQVVMVLLGQVIGLVTIALLVSSFTADHLTAEGCECFHVFWWAWFGNCTDGLLNDARPFWIYYGIRCVGFVQSSYYSVVAMNSYHHAELNKDETDKAKLSEGKGLVKGLRYYELPATVSLRYAEYVTLALLSIAAMEGTMSRYSINQSAPIYSIGQIIAAVIAGETVIRAIWVTMYGLRRPRATWASGDNGAV